MGQHLIRRPSKYPKFTHGFIDRHGKTRFYFRRRGFKKVPLPGLPWSPEFMQAYEAALAGQRVEVGSSRVKPGTIRALAVSYFSSTAFRSLKPSSQSGRRSVIEKFCRELDREGHPLGDKSGATLQREHIVRLLAARAEKPESANALRKALRAMMQHAVEMGLRPDDPTRDVKAIKVKTEGFHSWTDAEISQFEARHPVGSRARLALALLLYTGQRGSDVVGMGRQHVRDGAILVQQIKTGVRLEIPIYADLAEIIAATPSAGLAFLANDHGRPFTIGHFGIGSATVATRPGCGTAAPMACAKPPPAAWRKPDAPNTRSKRSRDTRSLAEVIRYTRAADQKRLAVQAMNKLRTETGQPSPRLAKKEKNNEKSNGVFCSPIPPRNSTPPCRRS